MPDNELSSRLVSFGLTKQEAELFVLLNRVRNSGAAGVTGGGAAELTKLGRVRTYQILQHLASLGLVEVEPGRPKRYAAVIPQVGMRRLVALEESRLTDLSLLESQVSEELSKAPPIRTGLHGGEEKENKEGTMLLRGVSNIQTAARRAMEGQDLRIAVNEDSEDHVTTTVRYMSHKPRSVRIIFATRNEEVNGFGSSEVEIGGYTYEGRIFRGELPTFVLARNQCLFFTYATQRRRLKPLSPMNAKTIVSECIAVKDTKFVAQMGGVYERFWEASK
jgi:hypothetical protein